MSKKLWLGAVAALAVFAATSSAQAAPVTYKLNFDGSGSGLAGTGSFTYDAATTLGSGLAWDFGSGRTGGVSDSLFSTFPFIGDLFFNSILFHPNSLDFGAAFTPSDAGFTFGPFGEDTSYFCWGTLSSFCGMPDSVQVSYLFVDIGATGGRTVYTGYITTNVTTVPEPASLFLLLSALAIGSLVQIQKRRRH